MGRVVGANVQPLIPNVQVQFVPNRAWGHREVLECTGRKANWNELHAASVCMRGGGGALCVGHRPSDALGPPRVLSVTPLLSICK